MRGFLKKFSCAVLMLGIVIASSLAMFACGFNYVYEIAISDAIYEQGAQVVSIYFTNANDSTTFKTTISTSNIKFEGDLYGRYATKVELTSGNRLEVTLGGKCVVSSVASSKNRIVVMGEATSDGKNYACNISKVLEAGLISISNTNEAGVFSSVFKTTSGTTFDEEYIFSQFITVTNGEYEEISVIFNEENNTVTVSIENFDVTSENPKPIVRFAPETTSLNKALTVAVGGI